MAQRTRLRHRIALIVALLLPGAALAAPAWHDGQLVSVQTTSCFLQQTETLASVFVGWFGDVASPPPLNSVYYTRVVWGVVGRPCGGGAHVAPEIFLPSGTTLAISATNKVRCFAVDISTGASQEETAACPQVPSVGVDGGLAFYAVGQTNPTWPTGTGKMWEIHVPVLSTARLDGLVPSSGSCPACLSASVWLIDGVFSPKATPRVGVVAGGAGAPATPTITYPSPSVSAVGNTTATTHAILERAGTTGDVFAQISTTPPSGSTCTATTTSLAITAQTPASQPLDVLWSMLTPGTTHYWRQCYRSGATTFWGTTQSFTTTGTPPPRILSLSRSHGLPGTQVTISGSGLAGATVRLDNIALTTSAVTATAITFTVPPGYYSSYTGRIVVTTPAGTATSSSTFTIGIKTFVDSVEVLDSDGDGLRDDVAIRFHASEPFPYAEAECALVGSPWAMSCRAGDVIFTDLAPGAHSASITAYAYAAWRKWSDTVVVPFTIGGTDTTPPETTMTSGHVLFGWLDTNSTSFSFSSPEAGVTFECALDSLLYVPCTSPHTVSGLADGYHSFAVRARDAANNVDPTPAGRSFVVDTVPPAITMLVGGPAPGSSTTSRTASFSVLGDATRFQCKLDGGAWVACPQPLAYTNLALGSHTVQARAQDLAGNVDATPATRTWTIVP